MQYTIKLFIYSAAISLLVACGSETPSTPEAPATPEKIESPTAPADTGEGSIGRVTLRGELVYRQRIALSPNVTATVALIDTGAQGEERRVITESRLSQFGQVPIAFSLTLPGDAIQSNHSYQLQAAIEDAQGTPLWHTATPVDIDPLDKTSIHQIQLQQVQKSQQLTYECNGLSFQATVTRTTATLELKNRVLELPSVRSASGAKYSDGDNTFWSKGDRLSMLILSGKTYKDCTAVER